MDPCVSVVMPVHNREQYVGKSIESILDQTFHDFEFLIMDDGSTDGTPHILQSYADQDSRIRLFLRERQGQTACRNELMHLARAEFMALMDSDDIAMPDRLERQVAIMRARPHLVVLGTRAILIDSRGRVTGRKHHLVGAKAVADDLKRGCPILHPTVMMRRQAILSLGGYRAAYDCAEDYDLFLRASERGEVDNARFVGLAQRHHDTRISRIMKLRQRLSHDLAIAMHLRRLRGETDPTEHMTASPHVDDPVLDELLPPGQIAHHRAQAAIFSPHQTHTSTETALRSLLAAKPTNKQNSGYQRALATFIMQRPFDATSARLIWRGLRYGPARFVRALFKQHTYLRETASF